MQLGNCSGLPGGGARAEVITVLGDGSSISAQGIF